MVTSNQLFPVITADLANVFYRPGWGLTVENTQIFTIIGIGQASRWNLWNGFVRAWVNTNRTVAFVAPMI